MINSYLGVEKNHYFLMRRGTLDTYTVSAGLYQNSFENVILNIICAFIESISININVNLNRIMLKIKPEQIEYYMLFNLKLTDHAPHLSSLFSFNESLFKFFNLILNCIKKNSVDKLGWFILP
jgi:hypothetical protein